MSGQATEEARRHPDKPVSMDAILKQEIEVFGSYDADESPNMDPAVRFYGQPDAGYRDPRLRVRRTRGIMRRWPPNLI